VLSSLTSIATEIVKVLKHFQLVAKLPLMNLTRLCPPLGAATMHDSLLIPGGHIAHDKLTIAAHFL
jgi:hypothetical protein